MRFLAYTLTRPALILVILLICSVHIRAQFLMDMIDTTKELGRTSYRTIDRFNHIRISGYMQPQWQLASSKGVPSYSGGDFAPNSSNRFMLRRGRIRFDYAITDKEQRNRVQFAFQMDGTERGVFIRDLWGRYWENKWQVLALTSGMFARPFGFEVNLSSGDRESPERGRMSQILLRTERDLGVMASLEKRRNTAGWKFFRIEGGVFNGQGLTGPQEFDNYKDFIGQITIKPTKVGDKLLIGGGIQTFLGSIIQNGKSHFRLVDRSGLKYFSEDSVAVPAGGRLPRIYHGANLQVRLKTTWGNTELRGEYWSGTQTATQFYSETPGILPLKPDGSYEPLYIRNFDGGFFYFLQHIVNTKHQLVLKFDWYDPNRKLAGSEIGTEDSNTSSADIKFSTWGLGYIYYLNDNLKIVLYHEWIKNESTRLAGFYGDVSDNIFTLRTQIRF